MLAEGFKDDALLRPDNWVHLLPPVLQGQGRATVFKPEEEEPGVPPTRGHGRE